MKIGFMCGMANNGINSIDAIVKEVKDGEKMGFHQAWMPQIFSTDAITVMAIAGRETTDIRLGTAVTPSFPRHPTSLALQTLTANAACNGRFDLGLGLSHKILIEDMYGIPYQKPAKHMREYLEVLMPLVNGEACDFSGDEFKVKVEMNIPDSPPCSVIVAALGEKMLEVAGTLADGTTTWMTGPKTLEQHTIPKISAAAERAGKAAPRIVASFPVVLTNDADSIKTKLAEHIAMYGILPSYRNMLDIEGAKDPIELAIVGDENVLRQKIQQLASIGVTDFNAFCYPIGKTMRRTKEFLAAEL